MSLKSWLHVPSLRLPHPTKMQRSSLRLVCWALAAFAVYILALFGGLVVQGYRMEEQAASKRAEIARLEQQQRDLEARLGFAKSDAAVERIAREKLDMSRPEDTILQLQIIEPPTPAPVATPAAQSAPPAPPAEANWRRWWRAIFGS